MKLKRYIGEYDPGKKHRYDFRFIQNKKEREAWIKKNWETEE